MELGVEGIPHLAEGGLLGAVGAHHLDPGDRLAHGGERVGDGLTHPVVRLAEDPLEPQQQEGVEGHRRHHHHGQPPFVEGHGGDRQQHLGGADHHPDAAPVHEVLDAGDVRGHPRHQRSPPLRLDVEQRQTVEVGEHLHPEVGQAPGRRHAEAVQGGPVGERRHQHRQDGERPLGPDPDQVDPGRPEEVLVDDSLQHDRHHQLETGPDHREEHGDEQPPPEGGCDLQDAPQRRRGGDAAVAHDGASSRRSASRRAASWS